MYMLTLLLHLKDKKDANGCSLRQKEIFRRAVTESANCLPRPVEPTTHAHHFNTPTLK